jgi:PAS domain S-box-containing protein
MRPELNPLPSPIEPKEEIRLRNDRGQRNSLVSKLTFIALQVFIGMSIYYLVRNMVFPTQTNLNVNMMTIFIGSMIATVAAFLILYKYQLAIQDLTVKSEKMEKQIDESTAELLQANREMRQEITERKEMEAALSESEERFRTIVREAALGIAVINMEGRLVECNPALQKMLGYAPEELSNMVFLQLSPPGNDQTQMKHFRALLKGRRRSIHIEKRFLRKDGQEGWWRQSISMVRNPEGEAKFVISMIEDITEQRIADEKIKKYQDRLKSLASELSLTEERERRDIATILHDHIGQILSLAKIKTEELQDSNGSKGIKGPIMEVHRLIDKSIQYTRSLVFELSPPILYDVGFAETVEWLAEYMGQQHSIPIQVEISHPADSLNNEERILLFRAVRELIFNIIKHAKANLVKIYIQRDGGNLQVIVEDNGIGFPPDKLPSKVIAYNEFGGFGLLSIYERLTYLGGKLDIESNPNQGTRVTMKMPLKLEDEHQAEQNKLSVSKPEDSSLSEWEAVCEPSFTTSVVR